MRYRIRVRLAELGKKQVDIVEELRKRGFRTSPSRLSNILSGREYADDVLEAANDIVTKWEEEKAERR